MLEEILNAFFVPKNYKAKHARTAHMALVFYIHQKIFCIASCYIVRRNFAIDLHTFAADVTVCLTTSVT